MIFLPTYVLTAVLAMTVSAATVLPCLACNAPSITAGQARMGLYAPTTIAPAVMLPTWQGSELRLHTRAPIGMDIGAEEVDLEKRGILKHTIFGSQGVHDPSGIISDEVAAKSPANWKELNGIRKGGDGSSMSRHNIAFEEARTREKYFKAPLRVLKAKASHYMRKGAGHAVRLFHKETGDRILAGTSKDAHRQTLDVVDEKNSRRMKEIHEKFNAPHYGSSPPAPPSHHHESGPAATPYGLATGYLAPSQHYATGHPVPPYAQGPPVPMAPPHYHQSVHPEHPFLPSYPPPGVAPGLYSTMHH